jgi:hypothetical protein
MVAIGISAAPNSTFYPLHFTIFTPPFQHAMEYHHPQNISQHHHRQQQ